MGDDGVPAKEPTALGWWLLGEMDARHLSQTELSTRMGVAQATISRWIYRDIRPDTDKLSQLADALGLDEAQRADLFRRAGHSLASIQADEGPAVDVIRPMHPLAVEIQRMLADESPVGERDREMLETILDRVIEPYRKVMRRRKTA